MFGFDDPDFWRNFWPSFWSNLLASSIVALVLTGVIAWIISRARKIEAKVKVTTTQLNAGVQELRFFLMNTGNHSFKGQEIYWHVFVETEGEESIECQEIAPLMQDNILMIGKQFIYYRGLMGEPIFFPRGHDLFILNVPTGSNPRTLLYFLSTAYGLFPRSTKLNKHGDVNGTTLGKIEVMQ